MNYKGNGISIAISCTGSCTESPTSSPTSSSTVSIAVGSNNYYYILLLYSSSSFVVEKWYGTFRSLVTQKRVYTQCQKVTYSLQNILMTLMTFEIY